MNHHLVKGCPLLVLYLINATLRESGLFARISSRITTVIRVVMYYQINYN